VFNKSLVLGARPFTDGKGGGLYALLGHERATVQWHKWIMPKGLVRAVGIEPTLLSERDFELGLN